MGLIDRIRYYDGEFLRAVDFSDEQSYHLEMRRRINRYLHLYGIVQGLQVSGNTGGVSILPGMAIDAYGREIYVFQPYTLGDNDISNNRITKADNYDVWLRYQKTAGTPPSSGYGNCNQTNQYTRWAESYSVVLLRNPSHPFTIPTFATDDEDNPTQDQVGVLLGTVSVAPGTSSEFTTTTLTEPHFLGVIAQRIHTPFPYDATQSFQFQNKQSPRNPAVSLEIEPNIFAKQNLILGPDFDLTQTSGGVGITPSPAFGTSPGSAKIAGDLVVQGNIYSFIPATGGASPQWLGLSAYVQQLVTQSMPDFIVSSPPTPVVVAVNPNNGSYVSSSTPILVTSNKIPQITSFTAFAYINQFQFDTQTNVGSLGGLQVKLSIDSIVPQRPAGNACTINVNWTAGPATGVFSAINNFELTGVFICFA